MSTMETGITTEQLLAIPDDGIERNLIRGFLKEREMTRRNRIHAPTEAKIVFRIAQWIEANNECFHVLSGEVGCILARNPDTTVGIDVAVFSDEVIQSQTSDTSLVTGIPTLAVEILSPSDRHEDIHEKIHEYLRVGVPLIWEVDPDFQTIRVYRPDADPVMFNRSQEITGGHVLPTFSVAVSLLFGTTG